MDFREGFQLGGKPAIVVTASDRTRKAVAIYRLDPVARRLENIADGVIDTGLDDPYGLCMYRSVKDGATYVFITSGDGAMRQWKLRDAGNGRVGVELARELSFDTQPEGCAADDRNAWRIANPALACRRPFLSEDGMESVRRTIAEARFRQLRLGQWVTGVEAWLPWGAWDACATERTVHPRERVVLAFDGSASGDSTALVGCTLDGHLWVEGLWENPGDPRWRR